MRKYFKKPFVISSLVKYDFIIYWTHYPLIMVDNIAATQLYLCLGLSCYKQLKRAIERLI